MKVLMLGWELPPHNSGGLGVACYQLCRALSKSGTDIQFVLPYEADHQIDFMKVVAAIPQAAEQLILQMQGIYDSYDYPLAGNQRVALGSEDQQRLYEGAVLQILNQEKFDLIHAHDWLTFRAALRGREATGLPIVLHVHSVESDRSGGNPGNPLVEEIESIGLQLADRIIAVSQLTKDAIIRDYGIPADKIDVIHNSIDAEYLAPLDQENAYRYLTEMRSRGYRVITSVGRLTIQKGLPNLLAAAKEVIERFPKTIFLIVGSGEQYYELIELAANLGISKNVVFTGFLRGKKWRDTFGISDLFVLPSISEPFGITPLEAVGYGSPVLISKQSGVAEVLHNSLKVDAWDIHKMANQIAAVVQSDSLRQELSRNASKDFEKLSWNKAVDDVLSIYEKHVVEAAK